MSNNISFYNLKNIENRPDTSGAVSFGTIGDAGRLYIYKDNTDYLVGESLDELNIGNVSTNKLIGQYGITHGNNSISGSKGFYYEAIDLVNKKMYLAAEQRTYDNLPQIVTSYEKGSLVFNADIILMLDTLLAADEGKGAKFLVTNSNKFYTDTRIAGYDAETACITYTGDLGFTEITAEPDITFDDYSITFPSFADIGTHQMKSNSVAMGMYTQASGNAAFALGADVTAFGDYAMATGLRTKAYWASHSEGADTEALELATHAEGQETKALGRRSHAEGYRAITASWAAHAEGYGTIAGHTSEYTYKVRNGSASNKTKLEPGYYAHAEGHGTTSSGHAAHSEGFITFATGLAAHAEGTVTSDIKDDAGNIIYTTAKGEGAHAEGGSTRAEGAFAHAEGKGTLATGVGAHAEGNQTKALANGAHAEGYKTEARGSYSHAAGQGTIAATAYQVAIGAYNEENSSDYFVVGIGKADARKTGFSVSNKGVVRAASYISVPKLCIGAAPDETYGGYFVVGSASNSKVATISQTGNLALAGHATIAKSTQIGTGLIGQRVGQLVIGQYNTDNENALFTIGMGSDDYNRNNVFVVTSDECFLSGCSNYIRQYENTKYGAAIGSGCNISGESSIALGKGLESKSNQVVVGTYNTVNESARFIVGGGSDSGNPKNLLTVTNDATTVGSASTSIGCVRNIFIGSDIPSNNVGSNGDICIVY
jgi:hypothetical protein